MGYSISDCAMIRIKEKFESKFGLEVKDDPHNLLNNMVDARACYKPSERVRHAFDTIFILFFMSCDI